MLEKAASAARAKAEADDAATERANAQRPNGKAAPEAPQFKNSEPANPMTTCGRKSNGTASRSKARCSMPKKPLSV